MRSVVEKCDLVWGNDGKPEYLNDKFERCVAEEAIRRTRTEIQVQERESTDSGTSSSPSEEEAEERRIFVVRSWMNKSSNRPFARTASTPDTKSSVPSIPYFGSTGWDKKSSKTFSRTSSTCTRSLHAKTVTNTDPETEPKEPTSLDRAREKLKKQAKSAGEVAKKVVGIPTVIICDMLGGLF